MSLEFNNDNAFAISSLYLEAVMIYNRVQNFL
jgi:hypothetical protein